MSALRPPKLTLRVIHRKLGDHYLDFMNANNPRGYMPDLDKEIDTSTIGGILIDVALCDSMSKEEVKEAATRIRRLIPSGTFQKLHSQSITHVAEALGYRDYQQALNHRVGDRIPNARKSTASVPTEIHRTKAVNINLLKWNAEDPIPEQFNLIREENMPPQRMEDLHWFLATMKERQGTVEGNRMQQLYRKCLSNVKPCMLLSLTVDEKVLIVPKKFAYNAWRWRQLRHHHHRSNPPCHPPPARS